MQGVQVTALIMFIIVGSNGIASSATKWVGLLAGSFHTYTYVSRDCRLYIVQQQRDNVAAESDILIVRFYGRFYLFVIERATMSKRDQSESCSVLACVYMK
eukprot:1194375-Prorocentrum_minimum.AAC.5